jgi:hypothetical protein
MKALVFALVSAAMLAAPTAAAAAGITIEQTAIARWLDGYSVVFVVRNDTDQTAELLHVNCAAYANDKLIDSYVTLVPNLTPGSKQSGIALPGGISSRPDRVECMTNVLYPRKSPPPSPPPPPPVTTPRHEYQAPFRRSFN